MTASCTKELCCQQREYAPVSAITPTASVERIGPVADAANARRRWDSSHKWAERRPGHASKLFSLGMKCIGTERARGELLWKLLPIHTELVDPSKVVDRYSSTGIRMRPTKSFTRTKIGRHSKVHSRTWGQSVCLKGSKAKIGLDRADVQASAFVKG
jgi:hypothetical protein